VSDRVDVAIVGGGPAGAALATLLARRGRSVVVLEARPAYRWHACGVFSGPAVRPPLEALGVDARRLGSVARDVPAMRLETPAGTTIRLTYGADRGGPSALGFDRRALDELLLADAAAAGACVERGTRVESIELSRSRPVVRVRRGDGSVDEVVVSIVVGADGIRSTVARAAGVARPARVRRIGLTFHVREPEQDEHADARMVVLGDAYCGLAPVPGALVNVGIVLRGRAARRLRRIGGTGVADEILRSLPRPTPGAVRVAAAMPVDHVAGAAPLGHRVSRLAGPDWLLVGDAAGFLDPFTGEGLRRALASAFLAADAIEAALAGRPQALDGYDHAMRRRFRAKDAVSLLVQGFLARPALFEYAARRLAARRDVRRTLELVLADLSPASRALDPRTLAALLAP